MHPPIQSIITHGFDGTVVEAECRLSNSLPGIVIVGLGSKIVDEAKERIRSALASSGIKIPRKRITINLAPADIPKDSTGLDLAIALSIMASGGLVSHEIGPRTAVIGELGLSGAIRPVRGIIGKLLAGKQREIDVFYIPTRNMDQAKMVPGVTLVPLENLRQLYVGLNGHALPALQTGKGAMGPVSNPSGQRLQDVSGQLRAKRALIIAAAGGHNLFLNGPPGSGKSMLASALPSLLPAPRAAEMLEITHLHSLVHAEYDQLVTTRPFRTPHHSISRTALIGGGNSLRPGEISLSHRGVLFLDELPEFSRVSLEALRQPLESRLINVSRAKDSIVFPADFLLIATANPCPCGYYGSSRPCTCPASAIARYHQKLSGPLMDRFDLFVNAEPITHETLLSGVGPQNEHTAALAVVQRARKAQMARFDGPESLNSHMTSQQIKTLSRLSPEAKTLLDQAAARLDISARGYMRVIKVARTVADTDDSVNIELMHVTEALQYRYRR